MGFPPRAAAPAAGDAEAAATASLDASPELPESMLESGLRWCSRVAAGEDVPDPAAAADLVDALARLKGHAQAITHRILSAESVFFLCSRVS